MIFIGCHLFTLCSSAVASDEDIVKIQGINTAFDVNKNTMIVNNKSFGWSQNTAIYETARVLRCPLVNSNLKHGYMLKGKGIKIIGEQSSTRSTYFQNILAKKRNMRILLYNKDEHVGELLRGAAARNEFLSYSTM